MAPTPQISFDDEPLILVDEADRELGFAPKAACHDGEGRLHRAFSLFVFDAEGRVLVQQRSPKKRLWGGYWSNSCCSHPRRGESLTEATARRLTQELGLESTLEFVYKFEYHARFGEAGSEHELCHVFVGKARGELRVHPDEISGVAWRTRDELSYDMNARQAEFTPWFKLEWTELLTQYAERLPQASR